MKKRIPSFLTTVFLAGVLGFVSTAGGRDASVPISFNKDEWFESEKKTGNSSDLTVSEEHSKEHPEGENPDPSDGPSLIGKSVRFLIEIPVFIFSTAKKGVTKLLPESGEDYTVDETAAAPGKKTRVTASRPEPERPVIKVEREVFDTGADKTKNRKALPEAKKNKVKKREPVLRRALTGGIPAMIADSVKKIFGTKEKKRFILSPEEEPVESPLRPFPAKAPPLEIAAEELGVKPDVTARLDQKAGTLQSPVIFDPIPEEEIRPLKIVREELKLPITAETAARHPPLPIFEEKPELGPAGEKALEVLSPSSGSVFSPVELVPSARRFQWNVEPVMLAGAPRTVPLVLDPESPEKDFFASSRTSNGPGGAAGRERWNDLAGNGSFRKKPAPVKLLVAKPADEISKRTPAVSSANPVFQPLEEIPGPALKRDFTGSVNAEELSGEADDGRKIRPHVLGGFIGFTAAAAEKMLGAEDSAPAGGNTEEIDAASSGKGFPAESGAKSGAPLSSADDRFKSRKETAGQEPGGLPDKSRPLPEPAGLLSGNAAGEQPALPAEKKAALKISVLPPVLSEEYETRAYERGGIPSPAGANRPSAGMFPSFEAMSSPRIFDVLPEAEVSLPEDRFTRPRPVFPRPAPPSALESGREIPETPEGSSEGPKSEGKVIRIVKVV